MGARETESGYSFSLNALFPDNFQAMWIDSQVTVETAIAF
jgi:hypothetical protein